MSQEHWLPQFAPAPARQGSECVADIHGYCKEFGYTTYTQSQNQHHSTQANLKLGGLKSVLDYSVTASTGTGD